MTKGNAFYNVYRPKRWSEILGQEGNIAVLKKQSILDAFSHSYLFYGQSGTGKTTTARVLSMAMLCFYKDGDGEPCGECQDCKAIIEGRHWDIYEFDAGSFRGIESIRELKQRVYLYPLSARKKIYIIDEAHGLTNESFDALLKILEEPPPYVVFILVSSQPDKIPITVQSRCQRFQFKPIKDESIKARLKEIANDWGIEIEENILENITKRSGGNFRSALNLLEQVLILKV